MWEWSTVVVIVVIGVGLFWLNSRTEFVESVMGDRAQALAQVGLGTAVIVVLVIQVFGHDIAEATGIATLIEYWHDFKELGG